LSDKLYFTLFIATGTCLDLLNPILIVEKPPSIFKSNSII